MNIGPDAAKEIFQKGIEPMELTENGVFTSRQPVERYQWPLGFAVFCLMLSVLPGDRRRKVPLVLAMLASLITTAPMSHADTNGIQEYKAGQYEQAVAAFQRASLLGIKHQFVKDEISYAYIGRLQVCVVLPAN